MMEISAKTFKHNTNASTERAFNEHLELYYDYVKKVNEITDLVPINLNVTKDNPTYSRYRGLKKGETFALDAVILHELYFQIMTRDSLSPKEKAMGLFNIYFGGFENWITEFICCGKSARGWAILVYEQRTKSIRNILLDSHDFGPVVMAYPLIVMDVYEHAYYMDYGRDRASYISDFIRSINWDLVEQQIELL